MTHLFSVIIPHHDIPQLLQRCLNSIPDTPDVQVIVVDDNSSPEKVDFGCFPGQERTNTTCIFDKNGGGAGHARNIGLEHADGRWLVFADSDDFFTKDAFTILRKHQDDPHDIILFKADSVDSDDYTPSGRHQALNDAIDAALGGTMPVKKAVLVKPVPWCKMFRREHIRKQGIRFDETMASNDQMFVDKAVCLAADAAVAVAGDVLYTVTTRRGSLMDNWGKDPENYLCRLEVQIRVNKFARSYPLFIKKEPILLILADSRRFGPRTVLRATWLVLRKGALFSGIGTFLKIVNNHTLKLNVK